MRQVRAKFRCMRVIDDWSGLKTIELRPVYQKGGNPENEKFWSATPSGEAELVFFGPALDDRGEPYKAGDYYYIDMHKASEAGWTLGVVTKRTCGGEVELHTNARGSVGYKEAGLRHAKLQMGFNDDNGVIELFGEAGLDWSVAFKWAEASDED